MRKLIILGLLAATVAPSVASAQSYGEARRSERNLREEKQELRQAQRYVRQARQEVREDWRDYRRSHRDVYRGGNWRAPFRYNQWNVGVRLRPAYYNSALLYRRPLSLSPAPSGREPALGPPL